MSRHSDTAKSSTTPDATLETPADSPDHEHPIPGLHRDPAEEPAAEPGTLTTPDHGVDDEPDHAAAARDDLFAEDDFTLDDTTSPPRRGLTKLTAGLGALVLLGAGFVGGIVTTQRAEEASASGLPEGVELPPGVELPEGVDPSALLGGGGLPGGTGAGLPGLPGAGAASDASTVSLIDGDVLYVQDPDGKTVKVVLDKKTRVNTIGPGKLADLKEGDKVTLKGSEETAGRFRARSITQTGQ